MPPIDLKDDTAVVIIGSGAGGGTLAHELTRRGIKVVLLEAGKRQSTETFSQIPGEAFVQLTWLDARTQSGTWAVARDFPTLPVWHCKTVGGTTVHWTASTPRLQPWELRAKTTYGELAGTSLIDWPIPYDELLRYYELAERRLNVTRRNGVPGLPASNNFKVMYAGAKKLGYKQVHTGHMAINSRAADNGEDLPRPDNRITLNQNVKDAYGLPVANIHVDDHPNDQAMRQHAQSQMIKMYNAVGAKRTVPGPVPPATHNMCTARMSADPRDGVTNAHGQSHDIKNLFISDGSVLPTSGAANPTLTIVALALRQADYLANELKSGNL